MGFLRELGRRLQLVSADHNSYTYLIQRLSVAMQRGNAASVLGSAGNMDPHDFFEVCYYFIVLYCISYFSLFSFYVYFELYALLYTMSCIFNII